VSVRPEFVRLVPESPALPICAAWRYREFFSETGTSLEDSRQQLLTIAAARNGEVAVVADVGGMPAGVCLYVHNEIDPAHDLSPWLASLYVVPEFRRGGIATALVAAIEDHARRQGKDRMHLYTISAEPFYRRLGWTVGERFAWHGEAFVLMQRDL
jgi:GNAT superfamily N-acetyltransferase